MKLQSLEERITKQMSTIWNNKSGTHFSGQWFYRVVHGGSAGQCSWSRQIGTIAMLASWHTRTANEIYTKKVMGLYFGVTACNEWPRIAINKEILLP